MTFVMARPSYQLSQTKQSDSNTLWTKVNTEKREASQEKFLFEQLIVLCGAEVLRIPGKKAFVTAVVKLIWSIGTTNSSTIDKQLTEQGFS